MKTLFTILCLGALALTTSCRSEYGDNPVAARGRYLVHAMGCVDCHTPHKSGPAGIEPDMTRFMSGHPAGMEVLPAPTLAAGPWMMTATGSMTAWAGPWGVSYTANLTPDEETGLGTWTAQTFVDTIRTGRHMGNGRQILPPMPVEAIKNFNDDDLRAIFVYLKSLPPLRNRVPAPTPPVER